MTEIRPIDLPEKDLPLRADVSLLGRLVGEMLVEQHGAGLLEQVEAVRKAAILRREEGSESSAGLEKILARLGPAEVRQVIHAFSYYLRMVNLAEKVHRIRRRRAYQRALSAPQRGSLEAVIGNLQTAGISPQAMRGALNHLQIQPVFTAHPTEATRRTIQEKEYDIVLRLVERLNPERTPDEEALALQRIGAALTSAWQTRLVPHSRPAVADELDNILFYLTDILYRVVPVFYDSLALAVARHYGADPPGQGQPVLLHFGSWVGADMDGNPNVTAATIEETLASQRRAVIQRYLPEVKRLGLYLSQTKGEIPVSEVVSQRLDEYAAYLPEVSKSIPERHRDMPYRCLLKWVAARLQATLGEHAGAYASADEFIGDIRLIETSLLENKGEHAGLFGVRRLLLRARTFGFHLMTLDVRQDALVHRRAMAQWLADERWMEREASERTRILAEMLLRDQLPQAPRDRAATEWNQSVAVFRTIASTRRRFGEDAVGLFIISMTQGADDVLTALALARAAAGCGNAELPLDIAPLLETVDDLSSGPDIIEALLEQAAYRNHLQARGERQVVMVGYSDSNKDSGIVSSRWALQEAQRKLLETGAREGVEIVFFHGRGGTVSRGGGNLVNGILGAPAGSINGYMRLTEQGEVINQKYGVRPIALRNLELITGATLSHSLRSRAPAGAGDAGRIMHCMAQVSRQKYRSLVYDNRSFPAFFRAITPIDVIERLTIGSRPASRRSGEGIGNLRAIPWVFSWAQTRIGFPGVFGMGAALQQAVTEFGIEALRSLLAEWRFFRALVEDVEMVLAKSELGIGQRYAGLVPSSHAGLFEPIVEEFKLATRWILELKQSAQLLDDQRTLQRNIRLRNPYVDPLHMLQIDLLQRWRAGDRKDEDLLKALMSTVSGISLGIQNTG